MEETNSLVWKNLTVEVKNKAKKTVTVRILDNVSGEAKSGRLSVIMGPSGSGKSTLMNILTGQVPSNFKTSGSVLYNGKERNSDYRHIIGISDQQDIYYEEITVEDFLKFHSKGRNRHLTAEENNRRIDYLLKRMNMDGKKNTLLSKVSGGERKRVVLISKFMTDRKIFFLDEPTSGLDSHLALELFCFLKEITRKNNLIMFVTIHQPSPTIVKLFDDFTFIAWGKVMYHGEYSKCIDYFAEKGFKRPEEITFTEYLFELTTEKSSFDGVNKNLPEVKKLLPKSADKPNRSCGNIFYFDTKVSFKVVMAIFFRNFNSFSKKIFSFGSLIFFIFLCGYYTFTYNPTLAQGLNLKGVQLIHNITLEGVFRDAAQNIGFHFLYYFILSTFTCSNVMDFCLKNRRLIISEVRNGSYTLTEFLLSSFIFTFLVNYFIYFLIILPLFLHQFVIGLKVFSLLTPYVFLISIIIFLLKFSIYSLTLLVNPVVHLASFFKGDLTIVRSLNAYTINPFFAKYKNYLQYSLLGFQFLPTQLYFYLVQEKVFFLLLKAVNINLEDLFHNSGPLGYKKKLLNSVLLESDLVIADKIFYLLFLLVNFLVIMAAINLYFRLKRRFSCSYRFKLEK